MNYFNIINYNKAIKKLFAEFETLKNDINSDYSNFLSELLDAILILDADNLKRLKLQDGYLKKIKLVFTSSDFYLDFNDNKNYLSVKNKFTFGRVYTDAVETVYSIYNLLKV